MMVSGVLRDGLESPRKLSCFIPCAFVYCVLIICCTCVFIGSVYTFYILTLNLYLPFTLHFILYCIILILVFISYM